MVEFLDTPRGRLAYQRTPGKGPEVVFFTGFRSDMSGAKALTVETHCKTKGVACTRFDYTGHGLSESAFIEGTISAWKADALAVIDQCQSERLVLVGSSMGGWIATLVAIERPQRVAALVGIASAPDFTEKLIWQQASEAQKAELAEKGVVYLPSCHGNEPFPITRQLIEDGRQHLLLDNAIPIRCPVRLLHGMRDEDVPYLLSQELLKRLESDDVTLTLVKDAGHRMSEPQQLELLTHTLDLLHQKLV